MFLVAVLGFVPADVCHVLRACVRHAGVLRTDVLRAERVRRLVEFLGRVQQLVELVRLQLRFGMVIVLAVLRRLLVVPGVHVVRPAVRVVAATRLGVVVISLRVVGGRRRPIGVPGVTRPRNHGCSGGCVWCSRHLPALNALVDRAGMCTTVDGESGRSSPGRAMGRGTSRAGGRAAAMRNMPPSIVAPEAMWMLGAARSPRMRAWAPRTTGPPESTLPSTEPWISIPSMASMTRALTRPRRWMTMRPHVCSLLVQQRSRIRRSSSVTRREHHGQEMDMALGGTSNRRRQ